MLRIIAMLTGLLLTFSAIGAGKEQGLLVAAMKGDYQAQRNLAFGYATGNQQIKINKLAACSWYLLILRSDSPRVDTTDVGNVAVYCDPFKINFDFEARLRAEREANALYKRIYRH